MGTVIVGSGLAGVTVAEGLRKSNPNEPVTLMTTETLGVYPRPLLSHGFTREAQRERLIMKTFDALRLQGIEVIAGAKAQSIDKEQKILHYATSQNEAMQIHYSNLVLAQGSAAFVPPALQAFAESFHTLNSLADLDQVNQLRRTLRDQGRKPHIAILGGGLIGCEVASDLATVGDEVTLVHGSDRLLERVLDADGSARLHDHFHALGISLRFQQRVNGIQMTEIQDQDRHRVEFAFTQDGQAITEGQDILLVATGFSPRIDLAKNAGLTVRRGIMVDSHFKTSAANIFAIGDVAEIVTPSETSGTLYPFVAPIRNQALHLVALLSGTTEGHWAPPEFKPILKIQGFKP